MEVIFPVSSEAVAQDEEFGVIPVVGGEVARQLGGCATCPYMKMNTLDAMTDVIARTGCRMRDFEQEKYAESLDGRTIAEVGGGYILFMRHFQKHGSMDP